jgi:hypothetical protein
LPLPDRLHGEGKRHLGFPQDIFDVAPFEHGPRLLDLVELLDATIK